MKKYIALLLAALTLTMSACSSAPEAEETAAPETSAETAAPEETEAEADKKPVGDVEIIQYKTLELEGDAAYDRANGLLVMYFTTQNLFYEPDAKCFVGLISDDEAVSISGTPDLTSYPDVIVEEDLYRGIAIKLNEEIPAGDYLVSVTFGSYIVSFEDTIE